MSVESHEKIFENLIKAYTFSNVIKNDKFVESGHGEWEDQTRTRCRILWRKPEQLASDIYDWAVANGYINSVCTVYELHSGKKIDFFDNDSNVKLIMYIFN